MRISYLLTLGLLALIACTKHESLAVIDVYECGNDCSFRKDTTLQKVDTTINTLSRRDTFVDSIYWTVASRGDIRIYEKSGNFYQITFRDLGSPEIPGGGSYPFANARTLSMSYFLPGFKPSKYYLDSVSLNLSEVGDGPPYRISGTFGARMIDTTHKDTFRLREGKFNMLCADYYR